MNNTMMLRLALLLVLSGIVGACDEAVVGRDGEDADATSIESLCQDLGREICAQACLCGGSDGCIIGGPAGSGQQYDSLAHCETFWVLGACQSPPNPASYYQDCLGTTTTCESLDLAGQEVQAAALAATCQNPNGFGVICGDAICNRLPIDDPSNQVCCVRSEDGDANIATCQASDAVCDGPGLETVYACDGPEDCGGKSCCGTLVSGIACTLDDDCPTDIAQYCHSNVDCPAGYQCIDVTSSGFASRVCANN